MLKEIKKKRLRPCEATLIEYLQYIELSDNHLYITGLNYRYDPIFRYYTNSNLLQYSYFYLGAKLFVYNEKELNEFLIYFFERYYNFNIDRLQIWF